MLVLNKISDVILTLEILVVIIGAVIMDYRTYKIKNNWNFTFAEIGLVSNAIFFGVDGLKRAAFSCFLTFIILYIVYLVGGMGAGDIKLFCAIACIMGIRFSVNSIVYSILIASFIAIYKLFKDRKNLKQQISNSPGILFKFETFFSRRTKIHFSYPIACGTILNIILRTKGVNLF